MQALANSFQNPATKPYSLISKTGNAHIIRHAATGIYGLALFTPNSTVPGGTNISANDRPCLVMYRPDATNTQMKLSLSNPDLGLLGPRSSDIYNYQTVRITFNGNWQPVSPHPSIILVSSGPTSSVYDFVTYQGLPIEADFEIFNITDVADNTKTGSIALFPNPFTEETTILFPDEQQNTDITITNLLGETLRSQFFSGRKLTIRRGELPCGSYILHIDDKKSVYSFKLIIE
jgi:chondroitin-sulfate-ABC endolyase/exolyase